MRFYPLMGRNLMFLTLAIAVGSIEKDTGRRQSLPKPLHEIQLGYADMKGVKPTHTHENVYFPLNLNSCHQNHLKDAITHFLSSAGFN